MIELETAKRAADQTTQALTELIGTVREDQRRWLLVTGGAAFVLGVFIMPLLARLLPFGLDTRMAAAVMGTDRWNAGAALMQARSPEAWGALQANARLIEDNAPAINACRATVAKTEQPQRCVVEVTRRE